MKNKPTPTPSSEGVGVGFRWIGVVWIAVAARMGFADNPDPGKIHGDDRIYKKLDDGRRPNWRIGAGWDGG